MTKDESLDRVRYHWHSYIARGGFNSPKMVVGKLEGGGVEHWTQFLILGRAYLQRYPKETYIIENFVPTKIVRLLTGG